MERCNSIQYMQLKGGEMMPKKGETGTGTPGNGTPGKGTGTGAACAGDSVQVNFDLATGNVTLTESSTTLSFPVGSFVTTNGFLLSSGFRVAQTFFNPTTGDATLIYVRC